MTEHDPLRYPIGPFSPKAALTEEERSTLLGELARLPGDLRALTEEMTPGELETPYREGGWTGRQVVHHLPDSHLQGYVRFKLALTEDTPTIRTYRQDAWGATADARRAPVNTSLDLMDALHERWVFFLESLEGEDFRRSYIHPEMGEVSLDATLQLYVWHGKHHLGHLKLIRTMV